MTEASPPRLVVFCGLPGVGKTELSRRVADLLGATYLRIDSIESAIVHTLTTFRDNPVGYVVAGRIAADQLRGGRSVVADAVNAAAAARQDWVRVAADFKATVHFVEVTCSDQDEHQRRVESRVADLPGLGVPTWEQVQRRRFLPFTTPRLLVDNLGDPEAHARALVDRLASESN